MITAKGFNSLEDWDTFLEGLNELSADFMENGIESQGHLTKNRNGDYTTEREGILEENLILYNNS